jgi:hypothetical protein
LTVDISSGFCVIVALHRFWRSRQETPPVHGPSLWPEPAENIVRDEV